MVDSNRAARNGVEIQPDPKRLEAIAHVQPPQNKTDVRVFLGMVCQMEAWTLDLSFASKHMRQQTMKSTQFIWSKDCQTESLKIKEFIGNVDFLSPFDISLPLELYTDASKLGGLAYILTQPKREGKQKAIIQCGSKALSSTQANYSVMEHELLLL